MARSHSNRELYFRGAYAGAAATAAVARRCRVFLSLQMKLNARLYAVYRPSADECANLQLLDDEIFINEGANTYNNSTGFLAGLE